MYDIIPLYGQYSQDFGTDSDAQVHALNNHGGVAGVTFVPTYDPTVTELLHVVAATWSGGTLAGTLPLDSQSNFYDINNSGIAVGVRAMNTSVNEVPFAFSAGNIVDLTPVIGKGSMATGVNDASLVCGWSWNSTDSFIYSLSTNSVVESIHPLDGQSSALASAINGVNDVVGMSGSLGFCFNSGTARSLGTVSFVADISDTGLACGSVAKPSPAHYVAAICDTRQSSPSFKELPLPPGAVGSHGDGINNEGDVVGTSWSSTTFNGQQSAFIYRNGVSTDLNSLVSASGWHLISAADINDSGQIIGLGTLYGYQTAFLLNPPEQPWHGKVSLPELVGILLGGVAQDGGGWIWVGGQRHPVNPWASWMQLQPEKRDALIALAMDELSMFVIDEASREALRKSLLAVATSRLQALDLTRGRPRAQVASKSSARARSHALIRDGKLCFSLSKYGR